MQEKLISYLLGDLGPEEAAEVERRVADDPAIAAKLEHLRRCLQAAEDADAANACNADDAPADLADRTADSVSLLACQLSGAGNRSPEPVDAPSGRCSFSPLDAAVAVGVVAAVAMMLIPALRESRDAARRKNCQAQMQRVGQALLAYSYDHGGYFPMPPENANAGSFTVTLAGSGYADRQELVESVVCPGSPDANRVARGELTVRVPTFDELESTHGEALALLRRVMSLSLAYRSPYLKEGRLRPIPNNRNNRAPLLCDAPTVIDQQWRNVNHGCGLNVMFQDGSVQYLVDCREPVRRDHFFVNAAGQPAPPTHADDAVLMRSEFVPRVTPASSPARTLRVRARIRVAPAAPRSSD